MSRIVDTYQSMGAFILSISEIVKIDNHYNFKNDIRVTNMHIYAYKMNIYRLILYITLKQY